MDDSALRDNVVELLTAGHAHLPPDQVLTDVGRKARYRRPGPGRHTVWELLEHLRICQEDILRYTLDASWKSPEFPAGYWPKPRRTVSDHDWSAAVTAFLRDLAEVVGLARDPQIDLTAKIPHGEGRTYLREILLVADHNAYHLGQIVEVRRALGDWQA
jgi:uncharacterized damage-inducible protein DinB